MDTLRKFLLLSAADRWLLIKAALLLVGIKLGMLLLPFRTLQRLLARFADSPVVTAQANHISAERITQAVEVASLHTPKVRSCLTEALAAQLMLCRRGYPALLHIGVAKGERGEFQAHAWVESEGKVVIGGSIHERFAPLAVLEGGDSPEGLGIKSFDKVYDNSEEDTQ